MYAPTAAGLTIKTGAKKNAILRQEDIEMATVYADGPRPVAHSPVRYDRVAGEDGGGKAFPDILGYY